MRVSALFLFGVILQHLIKTVQVVGKGVKVETEISKSMTIKMEVITEMVAMIETLETQTDILV